MRVTMIGCGKLGLPCANAMVRAGHAVVGYDQVQSSLAEFPYASTMAEAVEGAEFIFIAVPTPHDSEYGGETPTSHLPPRDFDYSIVESVLTELDRVCTPEQTVVLISTVLPDTVRYDLSPLYRGRMIYNPYLIAMGSVEWDMIHPEMVIIGTRDGQGAEDLIGFYRTMMQNDPRYVVGTWEEAEAIKIFYNTFISTKIALVNMIQDVAEEIGNMNVDVVTQALSESTQRITGPAYMRAGMGDAGACHPRDNIALSYLASRLYLGYDLFGVIMEAREQQARKVARCLYNLSNDHLPIYIHGKSYKPHVPYTEGSYSLLIGHYLDQLGATYSYIDPLTEDSVPEAVKGVILTAHNAAVTYSHSVPIGGGEQQWYTKILPGSIVVDIWRTIPADSLEGVQVIPYGNTR